MDRKKYKKILYEINIQVKFNFINHISILLKKCE